MMMMQGYNQKMHYNFPFKWKKCKRESKYKRAFTSTNGTI